MTRVADHPLDAADAERSKARIADIELGMTSLRDGAYWRAKAQDRVEHLKDDRDVYGLLPHEESELATLERLLENGAGR